MSLRALVREITADPLGRGYAGMSDAEVVADLQTVYRDNWSALSSSQVFESIDIAEFQSLSAAEQVRVDRILGLGDDIQTAPDTQARAELLAVFSAGSATIAALIVLANPGQSRAQELGLGRVREGHVALARKV